MVEPFTGSSCMAIANQLTPPPGAYAGGADWGRCCRVLYNCADRSRKKLISELIDFFLVFYPLPTQPSPKQWNHASPMLPPVESPHLPLLHHTHMFWMVVAFKISIGGHLRARHIFFSSLSLPPQMMVRRPPHRFCPDHAPSPNIPPSANAKFWLVAVLSDQKMAT